jgi:hypothetical protein
MLDQQDEVSLIDPFKQPWVDRIEHRLIPDWLEVLEREKERASALQ